MTSNVSHENPCRDFSAADRAALREAKQLVESGDLAGAAASSRALLARDIEHPLLYNVIAMHLEGEGRLAEAADTLRQALRAFADDVGCLQALGLCLLRLEQPEEARPLFERVNSLRPEFAPALVALGQALEASGALLAAEAHYRRALALEPHNIMAEAGLAAVLGRRGDHTEAHARALRVLAVEPNYPSAALVAGESEIATGEAVAAEQRMRALAADPRLGVAERSLARSVLGDALDAQDRTTEAFAAYALANQLRHAHYAPRFPAQQGTLAYAQALRGWLRAHPARDLLPVLPPELPDSPAAGHVFLIGFPRSGTTLIEQVLARHPLVSSLEERENLRDVALAFMRTPADLARLGLASEADMDWYRRQYWQRVSDAGVMVRGKVFIDKHPLNGLKLALIARLFPGARILLALRDPRDVVLSCFRRRFRITAPYYELLRLESAAALYDVVMDLTRLFCEQLQLRVHVVHLERLIGDFDGQVNEVCGFLDLEWSERMREFAAGARSRGVATASGAQLSRGLNSAGVGEWRRYRAGLAPVLPTLNRWAAHFGYEP